MTVACPCCRRPLPEDDIVARRGVLINEVASLGAKIVELNGKIQRTPDGDVKAVYAAGLVCLVDEHEGKLAALKETGNR